jgi:hypothetical protein
VRESTSRATANEHGVLQLRSGRSKRIRRQDQIHREKGVSFNVGKLRPRAALTYDTKWLSKKRRPGVLATPNEDKEQLPRTKKRRWAPGGRTDAAAKSQAEGQN